MSDRNVGRLASLLVPAACLLLQSGDAGALTDEEIYRELGFRFVTAGTRPVSLGGAFVALADDPTAAHSNPAGLVALDVPRFYGEYRALDLETQVATSESGSLSVDLVTGERDLPYLGVSSVSDVERFDGATFVGVAWPLDLGQQDRRLTIYGSRQIVLSQERSLGTEDDFTGTRFSFESFPNTVVDDTVQAYSVDTRVSGTRSIQIAYWSVGAALEVHPDFSFGYSLAYATLDLEADTVTETSDPLELFVDPGHPRLPASPATDVFRTTANDNDEGFAWSLGVHWHPDSVFASGRSPWRLGAAFRKGAEFSVVESTFLNGQPLETFANSIVVPDSYALGLSYESAGRWLITAEIERVEYSDMLDGFRSGVNYLTGGQVVGDAFGTDPDTTVVFDVSDRWVPRLGAEYRFGSRGTSDLGMALRAGAYRLPDDRIHMTQFNSTDPNVNEVYLQAFGEGQEENHVTVGLGYAWRHSLLEVAGDFGDDSTQVVLGYTFRLTEGGLASTRP